MIALRVLIVFLGFSFPVFSQNLPHLVLYFDVNETLIAFDKAGDKSTEDILNELLAQKYSACIEELMFKPRIIDNQIVTKFSRTTKTPSKHWLQHFVNHLRDNSHPLYETVLAEYNAAMQMITASDNQIFSSFYHLVAELDRQNISYSIILRSFGYDIAEVKTEIEKKYPSFFGGEGKFRSGNLHLENETVNTPHMIYDKLRRIAHTTIHDDYDYWFANHKSAKKGKPFLINKADHDTLCIFFDDNIRENDSSNIIAAIDVTTGDSISIKELIASKQLVRVDTLEAISDVEYFTKHIQEAIKWHNQPQVMSSCY